MSDHIIDHRDLNLAGDSDVVVMEATDEFHSSLRTTGAGLKSESTNACFHQSSSSIIARDEGGGGDNLNTMNIVSLVAVQQQQRKSPNARVPNVAAESPTRPHGSPSHPGQGTAKTFPLPLTSSSRYNRRQRCTSSVAEATNSLVQCSSFIGGSSSPNQQSSALSSVPTAYFNPQNFTMEYLSELLKDKKQLTSLPNMFVHLERLVEEEVCKVRAVLFGNSTVKDNLPLPDPIGDVVSLQEKVYVPVKEYPDYNFVGRILGPRGMTAKQLEQETGCKIMVRGRGSMRDKNREEANRNKPNWEHLNDDLHVLVQCEDAENRAKVKLQHAIDEIKRLLVPAAEGEDELKRKQLMELAIINGTYRPANQSKISLQTPRLLTPMTFTTALRSPMIAAPIMFHSPGRFAPPAPPSNVSQQNTVQTSLTASIASAAPFFHPSTNGDLSHAGLFYNCLDIFPAFGANHYAAGHAFLNSPIPFGAQTTFLGGNDHPFLAHHSFPHHQPYVIPPPAAPLVSSRH